MKLKNIITGLFFAGVLCTTACKKGYLDINDNPNAVTETNITAGLIFPNAADATGRRVASLNWRFLNNWLGIWAASGSFARDNQETSYDIDFSFGDGMWQNTYNVLFDLHQVQTRALATDKDTVLAGAAMILKAKLFMDLVDVFGNIPYTDAFGTNTRPVYDKDNAVYGALQSSLDLAIEYMGRKKLSTFNTLDKVNAGSQALWIKFANTLKLKMLIHQSERSGFDATAEITNILSNGGGFLGAGENIDVNPGYVNETNKQSPFYANYGLSPTGNENNEIARANNYFIGLMTTSDPRLVRLFRRVSGNVVGNDYGSLDNPPGASTSNIGQGLASSATQPQWIQTSFECMFLEAEAILRGWLPGGDAAAKAKFESAIAESFSFLGIPSSGAGYIASGSLANWTNAGTTLQAKAKFIAVQKYFANAGINPLESWCDLRRLNMLPAGYISKNTQRISNTVPLRLKYPQSEYNYNAANVNAQGSINQFSSKIFWIP